MEYIPLNKIQKNPEQPRKTFDENELKELSESIKENGLILPISVYEENNLYYLIDGERRFIAAKMAGLKELPAYIRKINNDSGVLALVANSQRSDLTPIEEALAYKALQEKMSNVKIAKKIGKSLKTIADRVKLLDLDIEIQKLIEKGLFPTDHRAVNAILSIEDKEHRIKLARKLSGPGLRIKSVITACEKFNESLLKEHLIDCPSLYFSNSHRINKNNWNALKQIGKVPEWEIVRSEAVKLCDRCPLKETASSVVCNDCPAVLLISSMITRVDNEYRQTH